MVDDNAVASSWGDQVTAKLGLHLIALIRVSGVVVPGIGAWRPRIERHPEVFRQVAGQYLFPGTLNVLLQEPLPIQPEFRISGAEIGEPEQDMLFERCTINGIPAFRLRPFQPATGLGGHGDHILELVSTEELRPRLAGLTSVVVEFVRGEA